MKVSSNSEMVSGMALWNFFGALRELMLKCVDDSQTDRQQTEAYLSYKLTNEPSAQVS